MPQIIVTADVGDAVMFTERVTAADFESAHFRGQLAQRLGWAVEDAHAVDRQRRGAEPDRPAPHRRSAKVLTMASYTPAP